ncbi:MAG TPA: phenylalanine--tRNA ligase subunit beta [Candidatus Acidoferrales bacterium]|nr:phenylalanine--tRNA ligase subunit beta [Candidatus Acidoferrales bacterium]
MKILYDWLKEFVPVPFAPGELRERLSLAGIAVEGLSDTVAGPMLDLDLTINRPDCLGHYGVAREVAALARTKLTPISVSLREADESAARATRVDIESPDLCGRFTARVLRGVKVQPSPDWLRQRLEALGQASINNIVDATNYVMLELGHPMHAYDMDRLAEGRIVVRRARSGEKIRTLDGAERSLSTEMCVIADAAHAVGIGGIMGGAETEIGFSTRNVLLESAWFDPISVRRSSKALGLRTEASTRFERGADPEMAETASRRCAALIRELAGGELLSGVVDVYPARRAPHALKLSRKELLRVMGADVPDAEIEAILTALGFAPHRAEKDSEPGSLRGTWHCAQPSWRADVTREVDLIEEIARHYGLDKFPPRLHPSKQPAARLPHTDAEDRLRERLIGLGYREIVSIPLVDDAEDQLFRTSGVTPVRLANPLAQDASLLRSTGLVSMAHALAWNLNRGQKDLRLFEIGRAYRLQSGKPEETRVVTLGATGLAREQGVAESAREYAFADLKGDLDQIGELGGGFVWQPGGLTCFKFGQEAQVSLLTGGDGFAITPRAWGEIRIDLSGGPIIGAAGQLASQVADRFKLRQNVFLAEWALDPFLIACVKARAERRYKPISRFPAVERDFSLILRDGTSFASVRDAILALGIEEMISVEAIDLFRGRNIAPGKFSLLVRVTFQSQQGTLTEPALSDFSSRIVSALETTLSATLRTA